MIGPTMAHCPKLLLLAALGSLALPGWSLERLDPDTIARYGGIYSTECGNAAAARLRVVPDGLLIERDNLRMMGRDPQAAYSYFGRSPPPDFQVALLSQVRGKSELMFMVSRDRGGNYIEIDAAPSVRAALGPALHGRKYRQCEGAGVVAAAPATRPAAPSPPFAAAGAAGPQSPPYKLLAEPRFKNAWRAVLGANARDEPWLIDMNGPAPEPRWVTVAGGRYVLNAFCKAHDCYDNSAVQLYKPDESRVYGFIHRTAHDTLVGNPPPAVAAELQRLWQREFRQQSR